MRLTRRRFGAFVSGALVGSALGAAPALGSESASDLPPNVFFSPHGRPFRAPSGAPYPVIDWFTQADRNGDGKVSLDEFVADAGAFFAVLDLDGDGALNSTEVAIYEHNIAPEILGIRVNVYAGGLGASRRPQGARLWLAQMEQGPFNQGHPEDQIPGGGAANILPDDVQPHNPDRQSDDADLGTGASPYSLFRAPEPVTSADAAFLSQGVVRKANFLARAHDNFAALDVDGKGYLTLAGLPKSPVQILLERGHGGRRARNP